MLGHTRSLARGGIMSFALTFLLVAQTFALDLNLSLDVRADGTWVHYAFTRCITAADRPLLRVTQPPDNGTLHAYVRNPNTGARLGPIASIHQSNQNWHQLGPLPVNQCFRLTARKDGCCFIPGWVRWEGVLRF